MDFSRVQNYRIEWLVSFVAVAHHGGFSAAAKALYRSQPRISSHIADLEQALGVRLFDRTVQPVGLTPEGRALLPHAQETLNRFEALVDAASGEAGSVRGEVRLAVYPSAGAYLFPLAVRQLWRTHPHLNLVLREGQTLDIGAALCRGDVDLAVRPLLPLVGDSGLACTPLWREPLVAMFPRGHGLASTEGVWLNQIVGTRLVTLGESSDERSHQFETDHAFAEAGLSPTIAFQTNQPQTLVSMVNHGLGVGITNSLAMQQANTDGVLCVPILDAHCHRTVALWWRADQPGSTAVEAVRTALLSLPRPRFEWATDSGEVTATGGNGVGSELPVRPF
ncbi:LysR family transcriptional regulator [Saccharopolyspora sp. K220]|uniref:LysR family transcriptional regulator n=1 Tax=Saccharopolyspora soli TaxID=2926618 RepID=UPI001F58621C|nr:LysR family transcriptional regulator [Saccharopolyspora soli]MCI2417847.1 LysR family transcriptional regulator [Saccharopolyspora soli]